MMLCEHCQRASYRGFSRDGNLVSFWCATFNTHHQHRECEGHVEGKPKRYDVRGESNYDRLFGTPERAARTMHGGTLNCRECLIREQCAETPEDSDCMIMHCDALLDWLRGDAR